MRSLIVLAVSFCSAAAASLPLHQHASARSVLRTRADLPTSFEWSSSDALISPKDDSYNVAGIKDPSVVEVNGTYHVFASTAKEAGYNLVYISFTDFDQTDAADFHYLDTTPIGSGYRAAPQVFFFAPQNLWYLVFQDGNAAYSTNADISDPAGWSTPQHFFSSVPSIITDNIGDGYWVDMWVICDDASCHLYSSDDNGQLYRAETSLDSFPDGMDDTTVIAMQDSNPDKLFEAANVYKVEDSDQYLLIVEAIGNSGSRYFRSWTSTNLASDEWTPLADTEDNPFAGQSNVAFSGTAWTESISHGEVVRTQVDQTLTISPCNLRYLYQGVDPAADDDYDSLPWKLGLLSQTSSSC